MKDFQEFIDSLDREFVDTLVSETSGVIGRNAPFANTVLGNNFAVTLRILERYHEWLHEQ